MFRSVKRYFLPPDSAGQVERHRLSLLNIMLAALLVLGPLGTLALALLSPYSIAEEPGILAGLIAGLLTLPLLWLVHTGRGEAAGWLLLLLLFTVLTYGVVSHNGVRSSLVVGYGLVVVLSSLILPEPRSAAIFVLLSAAALFALYGLELSGVLQFPNDTLDSWDPIPPAVVLLLLGVLVGQAEQALRAAVARARESEANLARSNRQLEALNLELEARVLRRTRALELSNAVSRRLSTILDRDRLVAEVVDQLQKAFDYYHVHVYLLDETGKRLVMAGGSGEAGQQLLRRGHELPLGQGLVGRAAVTRLPVLAPDVRSEPAWLPNALLPDTRAEVAVPVMLGEELLGVLDVQHNVQDGLGPEDVETLTSVANQTAVGLQNARLYAAAQRQVESELLLNAITQRIQSTTTVEEALQVAVRELGRALPGSRAEVRLEPTLDNGRREQ
ncbi:MAG: GAF domain-containing protein [Chloroflexi bacterium]|nr:GAF domain-containing protein [Chloroflexota bacterium]